MLLISTLDKEKENESPKVVKKVRIKEGFVNPSKNLPKNIQVPKVDSILKSNGERVAFYNAKLLKDTNALK